MWQQIEKYTPLFTSAVLTGIDDQGYPFSLRCEPKLDLENRVLYAPSKVPLILRPGPACLLFHSHDERLWNQKSFLLSGETEISQNAWVFHPRRFIPGMGLKGLWSYLAYNAKGRRTAKTYLAKRGLTRPKVDWDAFIGWMDE
jgi:hypothetical protein